MVTARNIVLGFVAGALAVLIFHQGMYYLMSTSNMVGGQPWRMEPLPANRMPESIAEFFRPWGGVPRLFNQMFWGGLWGALFGLVENRMPAGPIWLKGFFFGLIGPMLIGGWLVLELVRGEPIFNGFFNEYNWSLLRNGFLLNGLAFGLGLGIVYGIISHRAAPVQA